MVKSHLIRGLIGALCLAGAANAADFSDPTWPCIQRKVETLSVGLMWPFPIAEVKLSPEAAEAQADLVDRLVLRRLELEEVQPTLDAFVADHGSSEALLGQVFQRTFDRLARTRTAIVKGIENYSFQQIAMSESIESARQEMTRLMEADKPDFDRIDEVEETLAWDERIYTDRQRSLTYVCETPVLIEKRLYAIAQMLQAALE
ncbi:hypothetical protein SAMN05421688_3066 [Poseidonocella pacifica]|uniref:Uncharacterized protein n=1 Tax=Poseidonocella pacifica TaxID=871651 RepID=A0A1I0YGS2_9RHOB|nr:hypothetical protein [Poseidonocella pacifica]SFB12352.1 hypothetical protein SAMN05421688_3066 [Poseidonocella pacifica]